MTYSLTETNKGYIIIVTEERKRHKYFLRDESHTKDRYIQYILKHNQYKLGKPFGGNIFPIYFDEGALKKLDCSSEKISVHFKMTSIWKYYRSFITDDTKPKFIKQYANELKSNLSLLGVDGLYEYVLTQA